MQQLGIFDAPPPRARRNDPSTSKAAAGKAGSGAAAHRAIILAALELPGNIYEIGARCGLTQVQVARRLPELLELKLAHPIDEKRDGCRIWKRT